MDKLIDKDLEALSTLSALPITEANSNELFFIVQRYFNEHGRDQRFGSFEPAISVRFAEFLDHFNLEIGTQFASLYFLFCYTLIDTLKGPFAVAESSTQAIAEVQNSIYAYVAAPFKSWVIKKTTSMNHLMSVVDEGDEYVFICRRATVSGLYAPGKSVYSYAEALLKQGKSVTVIALFSTDNGFLKLSKKYKNLKVSVLFESPLKFQLLSVIEILKLIKPRVILTETEFELISILGIINQKIPMIYLAQGYYNLPWYDSIGINVNLESNHVGRAENDFFDLPIWVSREILSPPKNEELVKNIKGELGLSEKDFVIGSFARMEKFSEDYLNFLARLLSQHKTIKILLAGPNDDSLARSRLDCFIRDGRVVILPEVDVNIYGYCLDLGLDTFPMHSGYSVLELMAKKIPVLSLQTDFLGALISDRLPETLALSENHLADMVGCFCSNLPKLNSIRHKTDLFMDSHDKSHIFCDILEKQITRVEMKFIVDRVKTYKESL